jgi:hypothetical protein
MRLRERLPAAAVPSLPRGDLRPVVWWALATLVVRPLPTPVWLQVVVFGPLVLVLPGYALTAAVLPTRPPLAETLVYTIVFSFCAAAAGGVLTQLVLPLSRTVWGLLLVAITLLAALVADRRDRERDRRRPPLRLPLPGAAATLTLAAALTICCASVVLATDGAHDDDAGAHFSGLWIVPSRGPGGEFGATVGVRNQEGSSTAYAVVVTNGDGRERMWSIDLPDGATRTFSLGPWAEPGPRPTVATLHLDTGPIRSVHLDPGTTR